MLESWSDCGCCISLAVATRRDTNSNGLCGQQEQIPDWKFSTVIKPCIAVNHNMFYENASLTPSCGNPLSNSESFACPPIHHVNIDSSILPDKIYITAVHTFSCCLHILINLFTHLGEESEERFMSKSTAAVM